jgi:hypothetical protein
VPESQGLSATAASGVRLDTLRALRDRLAREIEECTSSRDVAALARQLVLVLEEIDSLAPPEQPKGTVLDDLEAQRAKRGAAPAGSARAGGGR